MVWCFSSRSKQLCKLNYFPIREGLVNLSWLEGIRIKQSDCCLLKFQILHFGYQFCKNSIEEVIALWLLLVLVAACVMFGWHCCSYHKITWAFCFHLFFIVIVLSLLAFFYFCCLQTKSFLLQHGDSTINSAQMVFQSITLFC